MPRPQTDIEAGRRLLLDSVEKIVQQRGATDISMTELATEAGMSPANVYRFFESKEAVMEAVAEDWFTDKVAIMEDVVERDISAPEKMHAFFAERFNKMSEHLAEDPELFASYLELGRQYFEVIKGYVDLGDHYLSLIVAQAMEEGYFDGLSIDRCVSLINQMVQPYCNPDVLLFQSQNLSEEKLRQIIQTIFIGLGKSLPESGGEQKPAIKLVS